MIPLNQSNWIHRGLFYFFLFFCLSTIFSLLLFSPQIALNQTKIITDQSDQHIQTLEPGNPIERQLAAGESHWYQINLTADEFLYLKVEQKGIDVVVTLFDPDSQQIEQVDSPTGTKGSESLKLVAAIRGVHLIKVHALEQDAAAGWYEIKLVELRAATSRDRDLIVAEKTEAAAARLYRQGTAESLQQAKGKYDEAAQLWVKLENKKRQVNCLIAMGVICNYQDEHQQAIDYYQQALPIAQANRDSLYISSILSNIGATYYRLFDNQKAIEYYNKALPIATALGRSEDEVNMLNMIGMAFDRMGNHQAAIEHLEKAYLLSQKIKYQWGEAYSCSNIGSYYFRQSDLDNAFEYFKKAKNLHQQIGARRSVANDLHNLGFIYDIWQEKQKALDYFSQANRLCKLVGNRYGEANSINSMGWVYFDLGERQLALDNF